MAHTVRSAHPADAQNLAALAIQVWLHTYALEGIRGALSDYVFQKLTPERFAELIADPKTHILVCEEESCLFGYVRMSAGTPCPSDQAITTEIETLYVQEHHEGKGVGRTLLEAAFAMARKSGDRKIWLSVYEGNTGARAFYDRQGFEVVGDTWWRWEDERHRNLVLTLAV